MEHIIDIQIANSNPLPFSEEHFKEWACIALEEQTMPCELTIRFVEPDDIQTLNSTYRKKNKPTNVLAFPSSIPEMVVLDHLFLGDIIICPAVLDEEATTLSSLEAHYAHITIHGVLHLSGYNHIDDEETFVMQSLEIACLEKLGFENPYHEDEKSE